MDADQETIENRRKEFDGEIDWMKKELEKARLFDPAVSAQEAANTAGMLFEDAYGLDSEENTLFLDCVENPDSRGVKRLEWLIQTGRQNPSEEGMGFCAVDATTGKVISCRLPALRLGDRKLRQRRTSAGGQDLQRGGQAALRL